MNTAANLSRSSYSRFVLCCTSKTRDVCRRRVTAVRCARSPRWATRAHALCTTVQRLSPYISSDFVCRHNYTHTHTRTVHYGRRTATTNTHTASPSTRNLYVYVKCNVDLCLLHVVRAKRVTQSAFALKTSKRPFCENTPRELSPQPSYRIERR